jgi:hypothetical protein
VNCLEQYQIEVKGDLTYLKMAFIKIMHRTGVIISRIRYFMFITVSNMLIPFRELMCIYCNNYTTPTLSGQNA